LTEQNLLVDNPGVANRAALIANALTGGYE